MTDLVTAVTITLQVVRYFVQRHHCGVIQLLMKIVEYCCVMRLRIMLSIVLMTLNMTSAKSNLRSLPPHLRIEYFGVVDRRLETTVSAANVMKTILSAVDNVLSNVPYRAVAPLAWNRRPESMWVLREQSPSHPNSEAGCAEIIRKERSPISVGLLLRKMRLHSRLRLAMSFHKNESGNEFDPGIYTKPNYQLSRG